MGSQRGSEHRPPEDQPALTAIDLFSGAGGTSQGLVQAGYRLVGAVEIDSDAAATYRLNHPGVRLFVDDIRNVSPQRIRAATGLDGTPDLLTACPPCQGFSTLGTRSRDDPINDLVVEVGDFILGLRPTIFAVENVPGLSGDWRLELLKRRVRAVGYKVREYRIDAAQFGVPQRRRRLIVLGAHGPSGDHLPDLLAHRLPEGFERRPQDAAAVIRSAGSLGTPVDPAHIARKNRPAVVERMRAVPANGTRFDLPADLQLECHVRLGTRSAAGPYGRIPLSGPAPTLTTRCTTPACGSFIHPTDDRGISLREAALLQTFPPDYGFVGKYGSIERQIGNALPVRVAQAIGLVAAGIASRHLPVA